MTIALQREWLMTRAGYGRDGAILRHFTTLEDDGWSYEFAYETGSKELTFVACPVGLDLGKPPVSSPLVLATNLANVVAARAIAEPYIARLEKAIRAGEENRRATNP